MVDHSQMKLGKNKAKFDHRTFKLARYLTPAVPPAPSVTDYLGTQAAWGMMLNDQLGDCTIAGCGHILQIHSKNVGLEATVPDSEILKDYEKWCGYVPGNPNTDQGGVEIDVLNKWRKNKFWDHTLLAYAKVSPANFTEVQQAIWLMGGVYIGLALPVTAQTQDVWDVNGDPTDPQSPAYPGSWGGHCIVTGTYHGDTDLTSVTWGMQKKMTWNFWKTYVDEAYALLTWKWVQYGKVPNGFDLKQLSSDLKLL